eukprot:CAMPEP_0117468276 /NCGR_PEP_ID=MMETSP0784-20121206/6092_1 /TAXON_ID=39447 /ORGANISM="" /LENGTH=195 /DNA_ID=CAMNT_0005262279 /DNA_START=332 /DNA_END=918 /DNA_ORIENTATION=-
MAGSTLRARGASGLRLPDISLREGRLSEGFASNFMARSTSLSVRPIVPSVRTKCSCSVDNCLAFPRSRSKSSIATHRELRGAGRAIRKFLPRVDWAADKPQQLQRGVADRSQLKSAQQLVQHGNLPLSLPPRAGQHDRCPSLLDQALELFATLLAKDDVPRGIVEDAINVEKNDRSVGRRLCRRSGARALRAPPR